MRTRLFAIVAGMFVAALAGIAAAEPAPVEFQREIRPLLAKNCLACHGPDDQHREAGLRLDDRASALGALESGAKAIVPGHAEQSELYRRITSRDPDLQMPPPATGHALSAEEIAAVRRWIAAGAEFAPHWSFVPPRRAAPPQVSAAAWAKNPIDHFILARLDQAGLKPSPEADRHVLIRRVSLDLRGLPPSPREVDEFLADTSADAYDRLVDRMLADPGYGERWARMWLDLARYADSKGYGSDPLRTIWGYRDWVIDALNRNLPFDAFTVEQLAGDLLPRPTTEQLMATAFHRNTKTNVEGGTDDEEFRVEAVKDRVDTTVQVWMGLTMGCAKCHTHKYDPISQQQYYQFFALFNQTADADKADESPTIDLPDAAIRAAQVRHDARVAELKQTLARTTPGLAAEQRGWETQLRNARPAYRLPPPAGRYVLRTLSRVTWRDWWFTPGGVMAIVARPVEQRTAAERDRLAGYYRGIAPSLEPARRELARLEKQRPRFPTLPVMQELPAEKRRATHVLVKGSFLVPGETVEPAVLSHLAPWPTGAPLNRLGVARWLTSADNPLTARVMVNRYWAQLFGVGLVESEEDFGSQGQLPSHPELLDWLATEYPRTQWNTKALLKLLVTSATYRQSSAVSPELLAKDPRNRLLARGPRFRLEAEIVRDQALAIGGLLSRKMHGPSVFPPQPSGLWQAAFNGERTWTTSTGEDRYRRGIYVFWRRTVPYPSMATFDAPSREICAVRRTRTNTPLQAFVTLNDPVYVEAAQALARRIVRQGGSAADERARFGLRTALVRPPRAEEVQHVVALYQAELARYQQDASSAAAVATEPLGPLPAGWDAAEVAAWTVVSGVLLNLDGVLTKG